MHVSRLFRYPLKSARGLSEGTLEIRSNGPELDRRYMVVMRDRSVAWRFVSQRDECGRALARVHCEVRDDCVLLDHIDGPYVFVPRAPDGSPLTVKLHRQDVEVVELGDDASRWASCLIGKEAKLVAAPSEPTRRLPTTTLPNPPHVGLSDGASLLVVTAETVREIMRRSDLDEEEVIRRLRPNVVVENAGDAKHSGAFAEDFWSVCRSNGVCAQGYKPCRRCPTICVDQRTGHLSPVHARDNLLALLRGSDRDKNGSFQNPDISHRGVFIGMNFAARDFGTLRVGNPWRVITTWNPWQIAK